ncbi:MAG TPA: TetR/AcrR family transcriptional regulator [Nocardioides sp.]|nr:TetR/AcrR family transcriptional regulator [Nocardioides sp.]
MRQPELRERLLRAAEAEIAEAGPARASLRAIARRCGVSHQATAHHFEDRAGLFTALALEGFDVLCARTRAAVGDAEPAGGAQVVAAAAAYVEFALLHPAMFDVMFRPEIVRAGDPRLGRARAEHRSLLVAVLEEAQRAGWGVAAPTEELATLGWAAVHGLAVLERDQLISDLHPDVDLEAILLRVVQALDVIA